MSDKKYFWLKLKDNFFDDKCLKAFRRFPNGPLLIITYLKMQLISLKTEGMLKYEKMMPTKEEEISMMINEDVEIIKETLENLKNMGIIEIWDDETIYFSALQNNIGKETDVAQRVRRHRDIQKSLKNNNIVKREPKEKKDDSENFIDILNLWNKHNIYVHTKETFSNNFKKRHKDIVRRHGKEKIIEAISNYAYVFHSKDHYWSYKYTLWELISKKIDYFFNEATPLQNFLKTKQPNKQSGPSKEDVNFTLNNYS